MLDTLTINLEYSVCIVFICLDRLIKKNISNSFNNFIPMPYRTLIRLTLINICNLYNHNSTGATSGAT